MNKVFYRIALVALTGLFIGCSDSNEGNDPEPVIPELTTSSATNITQHSAVIGGNISSDGGAAITERGVCWSLTTDPTIADNKIIVGVGTGLFSTTIESLTPNDTYFVKAYAINSVGISYGNSISFTTLSPELEYEGVYEIIDGSVTKNSATGPDPVLSGNYVAGLQVELIAINRNTLLFQPLWKDGSIIGGITGTRITINETTNVVTVTSTGNATLHNTLGEDNLFTPGLPSTPGATTPQEFILNFEWGTAPDTRIISGLKLRYVIP